MALTLGWAPLDCSSEALDFNYYLFVVDEQRDGRRRRSDESRQRIVAAATQRFLEDGYVSTTIEEIAAEAGVAVL
jgi:hypothetical protein